MRLRIEKGAVMPTKRKHNGAGPGVVMKTINNVPMTKEEAAKFAALQDKMDATAGCIAGWALHEWLKWREA